MKLLVIVTCMAVASAGILEPVADGVETVPLREALKASWSDLALDESGNSFKFITTVVPTVESTVTVVSTCIVMEGSCPRRLRSYRAASVTNAPVATTELLENPQVSQILEASVQTPDMIHISAPAPVWERFLNLDLLVVTKTAQGTTSTVTVNVTSQSTLSISYSGCDEPSISPEIPSCTVAK